MGQQSITNLSQEKFEAKVQDVRVILLYPWTTHRNAFLSYIIDNEDINLIYYRITEAETTIPVWLDQMSQYFEANLDGYVNGLTTALQGGDPVSWGEALANDVNKYSATTKPVWLFIDECDRIPHDEKLQQFMVSLVENLSDQAKLVVSSRLLKYRPWYTFVSNGDAVVFGTERRAHDVMFTLTDEPKPSLEVYALGRGYALVNGQEITNWDGALPRNLFFYFVDNLLVTRDQIFEVFWPNLSVKEATNVFHVTKRKISERITMKVEDSGNYELTLYNAGFYKPSDKLIRYYDVHEFEDAVNNAMMAVEDNEEEELLTYAIDLYKGPFFEDGKMDWMIERRNELRQLYSQALIGMARLSNRRGDPMSALGFFIRALKETPEREDIHRDVMSIYLNQGMIQDAKNQYHILEKILDKNLGIGPSRESNELYELILARE